MSTHAKIPSGLGARRDQTYQEDEHDTYKLQGSSSSSREQSPQIGTLNLTPFA